MVANQLAQLSPVSPDKAAGFFCEPLKAANKGGTDKASVSSPSNSGRINSHSGALWVGAAAADFDML